MPAGVGLPPDPRIDSATKINWRWISIIAFTLLAVVFACYTNTFWYGLVFNDNLTLENAGSFDATPLDGLARPFTQPWTRSSYLTDMRHYAAGFGWYHLVSVWIHFSASFALAALAFRVARNHKGDGQGFIAYPYALAGVAGLIYACHPLAVQSATYISARSSGLGASNFLLALLFFSFLPFTKGAIRIWCTIITLAFSWMCLTSNEVALALAPSMVALFFLLKPAKIEWKDWALDHPFVVALSAAMSLLAPVLLAGGFQPAGAPNRFGLPMLSAVAYYATELKALLTYYTRSFFVPIGLSLDPPYTLAKGFGDLLAIGGIVLLSGLGFMLYRWRTRSVLFLGLWLTLAGFLPHAAILQHDPVADSAFYLSLGGLSLAVAWLLLEIWPVSQSATGPKMAFVLLILAGLTVWHNLDYGSDEKLIAATLRTNQFSELGLVYAAMESYKKRDYDDTLKRADEALRVENQSALAWLTKGQALLRLRQFDEARDALMKAETISKAQRLPLTGAIRYNLAESYLRMNPPQLENANKALTEGIEVDPRNARAAYVMGLLMLERKQYQEAAVYMQRAMQHGISEAVIPATRAMMGMKDFATAHQMADRLLVTDPSPEVQLLVGNAALGTNELDHAEKALKAAVQDPRYAAEAMALLSIVYERKGDKVLAASYHNDAVKRDAAIFSKLLLPGSEKTPANESDKKK